MIGPFVNIDAPVTVVQMLWINLIMDTLGGLAFASDAPNERYMKEKPKKRDEPILNGYIKYSEHFKLNGEIVDTNYARYESAYVDGKVEREAEVITVSFGGKTLTLNYENGTREE